ncbi:MAG TPA: hypothetical protein VH142_07005 [Polyangiaceae bacterium]|jgi:hypothetical protein|nr:hypothetical protein [Polyangiaceae bacterium]
MFGAKVDSERPTVALAPRDDGSMKQSAVRRGGRTIGTIVFAVLVAGFTVICSTEVILQAWTPSTAVATDCRDGIEGLIAAVRRAREAAAMENGGERDALARFRSALAPEWSARSSIGDRCKDDPAASQGLDDVDRLRFAEEHALRYEALDVARRRRDVEALEKRLSSSR